jgi:hypothetical protein
MHAGDQRIDRCDDVLSGRRREYRRVVADAEQDIVARPRAA